MLLSQTQIITENELVDYYVDRVCVSLYIGRMCVAPINGCCNRYHFHLNHDVASIQRATLYDKMTQVDHAREKEKEEERMLYVGNLSYEATDRTVTDFFKVCGDIERINIVKDR